MVTWSDDINLEDICEGINKYISGYAMKDYYIFGLQQGDRPHVRISPESPQALVELFRKSGYTLATSNVNEKFCGDCDNSHSPGNCHCDSGDCNYCNPAIINIGLRRDVRNEVAASRKLIKTIIFAVEGKLILGRESKLSLGRRVRKGAPKPKVEVTTNVSPIPILSVQRLNRVLTSDRPPYIIPENDSNPIF